MKALKRYCLIFGVLVWSLAGFAQSSFEYYSLAFVKYNMSDFKGAISDLTKAIEADPGYSSAYILRGLAKFNAGDYHGAISDYTDAMNADPRYTGQTRLRIQSYTGDVVNIDRAVQVDSRFLEAYFNRGLARSAIEDYRGAIEDFTSVLQIDPYLDKALYSRGNARYDLGDRKGACTDWEEAAELGFSLAIELLDVYCKTGQPE